MGTRHYFQGEWCPVSCGDRPRALPDLDLLQLWPEETGPRSGETGLVSSPTGPAQGTGSPSEDHYKRSLLATY